MLKTWVRVGGLQSESKISACINYVFHVLRYKIMWETLNNVPLLKPLGNFVHFQGDFCPSPELRKQTVASIKGSIQQCQQLENVGCHVRSPVVVVCNGFCDNRGVLTGLSKMVGASVS